jgi:hypothetical protein
MKYVCSGCNAFGCKLWRQYQTFEPKLLCAVCAGRDQCKDISSLDKEGRIFSIFSSRTGRKTDQIGSYVPAVPVKGEDAYWGYLSGGGEAVKAWKEWLALPSLPST